MRLQKQKSTVTKYYNISFIGYILLAIGVIAALLEYLSPSDIYFVAMLVFLIGGALAVTVGVRLKIVSAISDAEFRQIAEIWEDRDKDKKNH